MPQGAIHEGTIDVSALVSSVLDGPRYHSHELLRDNFQRTRRCNELRPDIEPVPAVVVIQIFMFAPCSVGRQ